MRGKPVIFQGFTAGVNLADAPYLLGDREARDARNVVATGRGALRKRDGSIVFATLSASPGSLFAGYSPELLIAQVGTTVHRIDATGTVTTPLTLMADAPWEWEAAPSMGGQGPYYGVNGTQARWISASGFGNWTTLPGVGKYLRYVSNRMLMAGDPVQPSRLYASKILDPTVWASPDGWAVDFDPNDGLPITGIGTIGPYVLVFKEHKAWVVYDLNTGANRRISDGIGCVSHRSIVEIGGRTYFLGRDGIYTTNGHGVERISQRIDPLVARIPAARLGSAAGAGWNGRYLLSVRLDDNASVENTITIDFDTTLDAFWLHSFASRQLAVWRRASGLDLMGGRSTGAVLRLMVPGELQEAGAPFEAYWAGAFHAFGAPHLRKRVRQIHFDGRGKLSIGVSKDFAETVTTVGTLDFSETATVFGSTGTFGGAGESFGQPASGLGEGRVYTPGVARAWSVRFSNNEARSFEVDSYTMAVEARRN